jgi:putative inorganic carbon (HCO3(-)) transporter
MFSIERLPSLALLGIPIVGTALSQHTVYDVAWLTLALAILLYTLSGPKAILFLLLIRPTLDVTRDVTLVTYEQFTFSATVALGIVTIIWGLLLLIQHRQTLRKHLPLFDQCLLLFFFFLPFVSLLWSENKSDTLTESIHLLSIGITYGLGILALSLRWVTLKGLLQSIALSAIIPITLGTVQLLSGTGITTFDVAHRIYGTFAHPNVFAFYLCTIVLVLAILYRQLPAHQRPYTIIASVGILTLILFTYTRAAWAAVLIGILIFGLLQHTKKTLQWCLYGLVFIALLIPFDYYLRSTSGRSLQEIQLVSRMVSLSDSNESASWRLSVLKESLPIAYERPLLGYGYGTFPFVWDIKKDISHRYDDSSEAHNDYLRILIELGIIGLLCFVLLLYRTAINYKSIQRPTNLLSPQDRYIHHIRVVAILTYAAVSLSDNMLNHTAVAWILWLLFGALKAYEEIEK